MLNELEVYNPPQYLIKLLNEASQGEFAYGAIILIASEAVLFFLNKRYFFDSGKAIIDLLKHVVLTSGSLLSYRNVREEDRVGLGETIIFTWSLLTSLIFLQKWVESLIFLGIPDEVVGFFIEFF